MSLDIVLCTVPKLQLRAPIIAPALLKSVVERAGFKAKCLDLNVDLWHRLPEALTSVFDDADLTFRYKSYYQDFKGRYLSEILDDWTREILSLRPSYIGFTAFSQRSSFVIVDLCKRLRGKGPKIVVGGPYIDLAPSLLRRQLIDYAILGDGEEALVALLEGNTSFPGINDGAILQLQDLNSQPVPDYTDFDMRLYPRDFHSPSKSDLGTNTMYITGSRGCVRSCSFCDVGHIWKKFRFRSGSAIAKELITLFHRHGISHFYFTDSLINGALKLLEDMCGELREFNRSSSVKLTWQSQFICRPVEMMKPHYYDLMREAGCTKLSAGIESGSEKVRLHMRKHFSNQDILDSVRECARTGIQLSFLLLVGYPTETEIDFEETIRMMEDLREYRSTITPVCLGPTMSFLTGAPIDSMKDEIGYEVDKNGDWKCGENTKVTRLHRWLKLRESLLSLGYEINEKQVEHILSEVARLEGPV